MPGQSSYILHRRRRFPDSAVSNGILYLTWSPVAYRTHTPAAVVPLLSLLSIVSNHIILFSVLPSFPIITFAGKTVLTASGFVLSIRIAHDARPEPSFVKKRLNLNSIKDPREFMFIEQILNKKFKFVVLCSIAMR